MIRLAVSVEGQTEEEFIKRVLAPHLWGYGVDPCPVLVRNRCGNVTVQSLSGDMATLYWNFDFVTSLVDFYGFKNKGVATLEELERQILDGMDSKIIGSWDQSHAFPYVQQYEFEGLLFSDVDVFALTVNARGTSVEELRKVRSEFTTPEEINDHYETAPSKRIERAVPGYRKVVHGPLIAEQTGLTVIRGECPRFNNWLMRLESLADETGPG